MTTIKAQICVTIHQSPEVKFDEGEEHLWPGGPAPDFARPGVHISPGEVEVDHSESLAAIMGRMGLTSDQVDAAEERGWKWRIGDWNPDTHCLTLEFCKQRVENKG